MNIIYRSPIVENNFIDPSDSSVFAPIKPSPCGPIMRPDKMRPMIPGILNFRNTMGESKIMNSKIENTRTGFFNGNSNSCNK
jgi:hypothetical protein